MSLALLAYRISPNVFNYHPCLCIILNPVSKGNEICHRICDLKKMINLTLIHELWCWKTSMTRNASAKSSFTEDKMAENVCLLPATLYI